MAQEPPEFLATWRATVLTLFPEMFPGPLGVSLAGKALEAGIWALETVDIRQFASDKHRSVDDTSFGGGPGMVMRPDVVDAAIASATEGRPEAGPVIYLSPRGRLHATGVWGAFVSGGIAVGPLVAGAMPGRQAVDKPDQSLVAAIVPSPRGPYYFRLIGSKAAVAAQEAPYRQALASLKLD